MLTDIEDRLKILPDYKDMNPYQLWFDAKYLLSELLYWQKRAIEVELQLQELHKED